MNDPSPEPVPVEQLAEEFLERHRRGEKPSITEFTDKYPALADEIRDLFPALVMMEELKPVSEPGAEARPATGPSEPEASVTGSSTTARKKLERLGDYRILREVGRGGMGIVYEAEQISLGRRVALKVLPSQALLDPRQQQRFQREAKAAARLHHTNIVPVFGVGEHDGLQYYVMQFINGLGLDEVLVELKRLRKTRSGSNNSSKRESAADGQAGDINFPVRSAKPEILPGPTLPAAQVAQALVTGKFTVSAPRASHDAPTTAGEPPEIENRESRIADRISSSILDSPLANDPGSPHRSSTIDPRSSILNPRSSTDSGSGRHYWLSIARIGVQVADALDYAHGQGIFHRDIKPSNLLLDNQGTVWVTDFGLAKASADGENLTHTGDILGTLRYMAPERFKGQSDARCDIYSLGLTLYELLVQRPAFDETDRNKLIHQVSHEDPVRPKKLNPSVPRDLETIVLKSIEREPARRYPTARDLAEDLKRFVDDKPIRARQVSSGERLVRWCRRNRALASAIAGIAALFLIGFVASTLAAFHMSGLAREERNARKDAENAQHDAEKAQHDAEEAQKSAEAAQKSEAEQHKIAEANLAKARAAVDYFTGVAENDLIKIPGALSLRRQVLQKANAYYEGFLKDHGDDPALQAELAAAYLRMGRIGNDLGQYAEVRDALKKAIAGYEVALARDSKNASIQDPLADAWQALGDVDYNEARPLNALPHWKKAVEFREALLKQHPTNADYKEKLAVMYNRLGIAQSDGKHQADVLESYRRCIEIRLELLRDHPNSPTLQYGLGESFLNLGHFLNVRGHPHEALSLLLRSQEFYRAACAQMPYMVEYAQDLGGNYQRVGEIYWALGDREKALESYQQCLDHYQAKIRAYPDVPIYRSSMTGDVLLHLARFRELGRKQDAWRVLRQASDIIHSVPEPTADDFYLLAGLEIQAAALIGYGKKELSADEIDQERREMEQASTSLSRAINAGFKDRIRALRDFAVLQNDPTLNDLRERHRDFFAALVKQMQTGPTINYLNELAGKKPGEKNPPPPDYAPPAIVNGPVLSKSDLARSKLAIGLLKADQGQEKEANKSTSEALVICQDLAKSDPKNPKYLEDLTACNMALGDLDWRAARSTVAILHWQRGLDPIYQALRDTPGNKVLAERLASFELQIGNRYGEIGLWSEAADHYGKAFAQKPPRDPWTWAFYATLLLLKNDQEGYRRHCSKMLKEFGNSPSTSGSPELIYAATQGTTEPADVKPCLELAENLDAGATIDWPMLRRALAQYRAGNFKDALQSASQVPNLLERWPVQAMIFHRLGQKERAHDCLMKADDFSKKLIQEVLDKDTLFLPWHPYWRNWAAFQVLIRQARELILGATALDDPWQRLIRWRAYTKLGQKDKAEAEFQAAVAFNPKDPEIWLARAKVFAQLGQLERAEADLAKAIEVKPDDCRPWIARGRYFMEHGQPQKADADFAKAAHLTPNELNKFIEAGWWVVGPYPDKLDTPCPPEKDPDPSRAVEPIQGSARRGIIARRGSPEPAVDQDRRSPSGSGDLRSAPRAGSGDMRKAALQVPLLESSGGVPAVAQVPRQGESPGATGSEPGAEGHPATGSALHWTTAPTGDFGRVDLRKVFDFEKVASYALTYVYSPEERPAVLWVGGDDYIRVWLNGRLIHEVPDTINEWAWRLNRVPVTLRAGRNTILVKVTNIGGAYGFHLRLGDYPLDRAFDFAKLSLWKESAEQFAIGLARGEGPDLHPERAYAVVLASAGDWDGFRRQFDRVFERWGYSPDKEVGFFAAISLNSAPWEPTVGAQLLKLTENGMNPNEPWRKATLAAACYRVGQYDRALQQLNEWKDDGPVSWALRALCHHQLGHKEDAKNWLDKLNQWHDSSLSGALASKDFNLPMDWWLWGNHLVMWREANKLIGGVEPKDGPNELALRARALKEVTKK
jgi:serine/threonine protein kinase/tetratricopeptide (TPR) repeat protein